MITELIKEAIIKAFKKINVKENIAFQVEKNKNIEYGDFSSNCLLVATKILHQSPLEISQQLIPILKKDKLFADVNVHQSGFINFFLSNKANAFLIKKIIKEKDQFGKLPIKNKKDVYSVEYVSANPTGYLHIGHARNAVLGNCIVNLLSWTGHKVISEYVINDAGNQMNNLATAVLIRYQQLLGKKIELPEDSYHGEEIILVAKKLKEKYNDQFINTEISNNRITNKDDEFTIRWFARDLLLNIIKNDLKDLGVEIEYYYSEYDTHKNQLWNEVLKTLEKKNVIYKKDDALWLKSTIYGDDKDRVLIKSDGTPTYFLPDIYYHDYKLKTHGTKYLIAIWGADHYSYITRMRAALLALGYNEEQFKIVTMQMVKLVKNGKEFKMSKRSGTSLTCRDLINALTKDIARWYLISQSSNNHIEIDVDTAIKKDNSNPYFYVQYAYARGIALLKKEKIKIPSEFNLLNSPIEREIINELHYFQYTLLNATNTYEPYKIVVYLINLAKLFHNFYTNTKILDVNNKAKSEQYALVQAVCQVIKNGLNILGIEALERM